MTPPAVHGGAMTTAETRYRRLLDRSLAPVCVHDGRVVHFVNRAALRALKAPSADALIGRPIVEFLHPGSVPAVLQRIANLQADGDETDPADVVLLRFDGRPLPAQAVAVLAVDGDRRTYEVVFRDPSTPISFAAIQAEATLSAAAADAVIGVGHDGRVTSWNSSAEALYGRPATRVIGETVAKAVGAPLDLEAAVAAGGRLEVTHCAADGAPLELRLRVLPAAGGHVVICAKRSAAHWFDERFRRVLDLLQEGVVVMDRLGRFEFTNAAARRIIGAGTGDLVGLHHSDQEVDLSLYADDGRQMTHDQHPMYWIRRTGLQLSGKVVGVDRMDGGRAWVTGHGCLLDPDNPDHSPVLFAFTDITEHYDTRNRLRHAATHDRLTGLPNRAYVLERAEAALRATEAGRLAAVLFIDLDKLKLVNDHHGHSTGDEVLRIAAQRMRSVVRQQDLLARLGGDEFVALLLEPVDPGEVDDIARTVHRVLSDPIAVGSVHVRVDASIGIATVAPGDTPDPTDLLRDADAAMYQAKASGPGNTSYFRPDH